MDAYLVLSTLNLSLGGLAFLLGLLILRENAGQRLNRVVSAMLFFAGLGAVLTGLAIWSGRAAGVAGAAAASGATRDLQNLSYLWEFFFPALFLFASVFPEERAWARYRPRLPWGLRAPGFAAWVFAPHVFHFALLLVLGVWTPTSVVPEVGPVRYIGPILQIVGIVAGLFLLVHKALFSLVNLGFGIAAMVLLTQSLRRAQVTRLRQQLGVITVGLGACLAFYSMATLIPELFGFRLDPLVRSVLTISALTLGTGAIAWSIVRYKFLDTAMLARRGILYALASAALVGLYLMVINQINRVLGELTGADARIFEPVFLIMALALFQPAVAGLEQLLDRVLLRDPNDYRNVVRRLGSELQTTIDLEELLSRTIGTVANTLLLRTAHIVAFTGAGPVARTGAGGALSAEALGSLDMLLHKVSPREASYRTADRIEGLSREERQVLARDLAVSVVVPLRWRDELVGALLLGDKVIGTSLTAEDVSLLTSLASQVSVSLQNALLLRHRLEVARFEQELSMARQIQRTSLLSEFPEMERCDVHALYVPSKEVGGDFYDMVPTENGAFLMAIADVSGKGMPAALLSSMLQASLRTQAGSAASLRTILRNINALLYRSTATNQFATFFLARLDPHGLKLWFSNAGHNWPVLRRKVGDPVYLERGGTVLGILEHIDFEEGEVVLGPGDTVVFFTDGVSEATDASGAQFGEGRLDEVLNGLGHELSAREIAERLMAELRSFLGPVEAQDDITILVLKAREVNVAEPEAPAPAYAAAP
jgi:serine phosphatase RsbU (regulator of sigma subunit)